MGTVGTQSKSGAPARARLLGAFCSFLLLGAACASRPEPLPLMADSLLLKPGDRGRLSSAFGARYHPILKRRMMHRGIDWAAPRGTPVRAAGHGIVSARETWGAYGRYLRIEHGGEVATAYAHLDRFARGLRPGQVVRQGELIGHVGSTGRATGPHLHYELLVAGHQVDPLALSPSLAAAAATPGLAIGGPDLPPGVPAAARSVRNKSRSDPPLADPAALLIRLEDLLRLRP